MGLGYTMFMAPSTPDYQSKGVTLLKDARITAISLVDKGANNHEFFLFKRANNYVDTEGFMVARNPEVPAVDKFSPLLKMASPTGEWKVAYCVVAVPGEIDQQKDVWDEPGIKAAAHDFMKGSPIINYMHQDLNKIGSLVESAIAPVDITVDGYVIKKGSWYVGIEPFENVKSEIDAGKIRGVSVQGTSKREDVDPSELGKFIDTNALHKNYAVPGAMPEADVAATSAVPTEVPGAYRNDETIHIPLGASGPGVKVLQRIVGLSQTGIYDTTTEAEFINYLSEHGLDPEPTLEILQSILRQLAQRGHEEAAAEAQEAAVEPTEEAPVEAEGVAPEEDAAAPEAPVSPELEGAEPVAKDADGAYDPAGQGSAHNHPAQATGAAQITPDSSEEDLKQILAQSVQTGNQLLVQHLSDVHGLSSAEEVLHHEFDPQMLQFMVNVFVLGKMPVPGAGIPQGTSPAMAQAGHTPRELMPSGSGMPMHKKVWDGSHGGHDPEANGKVKYLVRSFGKWARGKQSVASKKLLEHGVVKTPEAADRLAAWLKDQWLGSTEWRGDGAIDAKLSKRFETILPALRSQNLGISAAAVETLLVKMAEEEIVDAPELALASAFAEVHGDLMDVFQFAAEQNEDNYREVLQELRADAQGFDESLQKRFADAAPKYYQQLENVSKSAGTMTADEYTKHFDSAIRAVALGLVEALSQDDSNERLNDVSHVMADFDRWAREFARNSVPEVDSYDEEDTMDTPTNEVSVDEGTAPVEAQAAPMEKSATLDKERLTRLMETVSVLNEAIKEASPEATEDDSDTEVEEQEDPRHDPDYVGEVPAEEEVVEEAPVSEAAESTEDATELTKEDDNAKEGNPMSETTGSGLNDVIHFCNDLADSLEEVVGRLEEFDGIGSKIEKVGELAKNLDVSDRIASLEEQVKQLTEALAPAQEAAEATQEVAKRLEVIENQPGERTSVLADGQHVEIAKSAAPATPALFTRGGRSLF